MASVMVSHDQGLFIAIGVGMVMGLGIIISALKWTGNCAALVYEAKGKSVRLKLARLSLECEVFIPEYKPIVRSQLRYCLQA